MSYLGGNVKKKNEAVRRTLHHVNYMANLVDDDKFMNTWLEIRRRGQQSRSPPSSVKSNDDKSTIYVRSADYENENDIGATGFSNVDDREIDPIAVLKQTGEGFYSASEELDLLAMSFSTIETYASSDDDSYHHTIDDTATFNTDFNNRREWLYEQVEYIKKLTAKQAFTCGNTCGVDDDVVEFDDDISLVDSLTVDTGDQSIGSIEEKGKYESLHKAEDAYDFKCAHVNTSEVKEEILKQLMSLSKHLKAAEDAYDSKCAHVNTSEVKEEIKKQLMSLSKHLKAKLKDAYTKASQPSDRSFRSPFSGSVRGSTVVQSTDELNGSAKSNDPTEEIYKNELELEAEDDFRWTDELFTADPNGDGGSRMQPVDVFPPSISHHQTPPRKEMSSSLLKTQTPVPELKHPKDCGSSSGSEEASRDGGNNPREPVDDTPKWSVIVTPAETSPPSQKSATFRRNQPKARTSYHLHKQKERQVFEKYSPKVADQMAWIQHLRQQGNQYKHGIYN